MVYVAKTRPGIQRTSIVKIFLDVDNRHKGRKPAKEPRRWVVERLFSWLNRSRRLLIRWEKLSAPYEAFLKLACALICFHQCDHFPVFG